jgi:tetratricopeptide (TPR) repeat protein
VSKKKKQPPLKQPSIVKPVKEPSRLLFPFIIITIVIIAAFFGLRFYQHSRNEKVLSSLAQLSFDGTEPQVVSKIKALEEDVKKNPRSSASWGKLAMNLDVHDYTNESIPIYKEAAALDPSDFRWPYFIAILLAKKGDQESINWFERAAKIKPDYVPMLVNYGNALFQFNNNDLAGQKYKQALNRDSKCVQALFGLARVEFAQTKLDESYNNLKQALQINPSYNEANNLLVIVCKRLKGADCPMTVGRTTSEKTEISDPVYTELAEEGESSIWYRYRGSEYFKKGIYDKAIVEFEKALELRQDAQIHEDLAQALSNSGRFAEAADHFRAALNTHPTANNYFQLGLIFAKTTQYDQAEKNFKKAVELKSNFAEAYLNLAVLYAKSRRLQDAVDNLKQAIYYKPDYVEAHFYLAQAYLSAGDKNSALQEYQILTKLDPNTAQHLQGLMQQE